MFFSVDPLSAIFPYCSPYSSFNRNPLYFIDPSGMGGYPYIVYDKDGVTPLKVVVVMNIYIYDDDDKDLSFEAFGLENELEGNLNNRGFTKRTYVEKIIDKSSGRKAHKIIDLPIEFDICVQAVSMNEAIDLANENAEQGDLSKNFFYIGDENRIDEVSTARGGNSGAFSLVLQGISKTHEILHPLGFSIGVGSKESHWDEPFTNRAMYGAARIEWLKAAQVTQEDIEGINFHEPLKPGKAFGWEPLNSIYDCHSYDSDKAELKAINKNRTNNYGKRNSAYYQD